MQKLGEFMTLLLPSGQESAHLSPATPLVVLFGWLNASPAVLRKYVELYTVRGFQVLLVRSRFSHVTQPDTGQQLVRDVLDFLKEEVSSQPLLLHVASVGLYMASWMVYLMNNYEDKYRTVKSKISGLVLDSPVVEEKGGINGMVIGLTNWTILRMFIRFAISVYYTFARQSGSTYVVLEDIQNYISEKPIAAPVLVLFSVDDPVCQVDALQRLLGKWRTVGIEVTEQCWEKSSHVGHLVNHRAEYLSALDKFLAQLPLKNIPASKL